MKPLPRLKVSELGKLETKDMRAKVAELRTELTKLRSMQGRGTLRKESGKVRAVRRDIARILTVLAEKT